MKLLTASAVLGLAALALADDDRRDDRTPVLGKPGYNPECDEGTTKIILRQFSRYEDLVYGLCLQMFDIDYDTVFRKSAPCSEVLNAARPVEFLRLTDDRYRQEEDHHHGGDDLHDHYNDCGKKQFASFLPMGNSTKYGD